MARPMTRIRFATALQFTLTLCSLTSSTSTDNSSEVLTRKSKLSNQSLPVDRVQLETPALCPAKCECFNNDETVDCSRADLGDIPPLHNATKRLYLEDNLVSELLPDALRAAPNLCLLVIERNELTSISTSAFCGLLKLQELELAGNRIRSFLIDATSASCAAVSLKELDLSLNILQTIPANLVAFAPNLEILNLSYNEIECFAFDASYEGLTSLRYLDLSRNRVHQIGSDDLRPLGPIALEILNLAECGLVSIEATSLAHMNNLTSLSLSGNLLSASGLVDALKMFAPDSMLARLDVSEISMPNLTMAAFGSFKQLIIIDAAYCEVEYVDPELFDHLANSLETLHLEGGKLSSLDNLSSLQKLRRLHLQENHLESIDVCGVRSLESLDLSYNRLTIIRSRWLMDIRNLQLLNLSHNRITIIEPDAFLGVNIISTLDVSFNALDTLQGYGLTGLVRLDASNNVISVITDDFFDNVEATLNEINLSDNQLINLDGLAIPANGSVIDKSVKPSSLKILALAHNKIGHSFSMSQVRKGVEGILSSPAARLFQRFPELEVLDLSLTGISELDCGALRYAPNLGHLDLKNNNISEIRSLNAWCASSLTKLTLAGNMFHTVDVAALTRLTGLEEIDLTGNPFFCDCALLPFISWVNDTIILGNVRISHHSDWSGYQCEQPASVQGVYLFSKMSFQKICTRSDTESSLLVAQPAHEQYRVALRRNAVEFLLIVLSVVCLTVIGVVISGALVWNRCRLRQRIKVMRYRWQIRYSEVSDLETVMDGKL